MSSGPSANVIIYRCPICSDQVILVPPGFQPPSVQEEADKAAEHMKKHELVREESP